jgi:hypothetical protein
MAEVDGHDPDHRSRVLASNELRLFAEVYDNEQRREHQTHITAFVQKTSPRPRSTRPGRASWRRPRSLADDGRTLVVASHDRDFVGACAGCVLLMERGPIAG